MYVVVCTGLSPHTCTTWEAVTRYLARLNLEPGASSNHDGVTFIYPRPSSQLELFGAGDYAPADTLF